MRTAQLLALCLALLALAPAAARAAAARPADVLAEVGATVSIAELGRWERAIGAVFPGIKAPRQDEVLSGLAKLVGLRSLSGIDLNKPLRIVLLDPKRFPNPAVLVAQVARLPQLKAALVDSPAVALRVRGGVVALGEAAALERAGDYGIATLRSGPPQGLRATAFLQPIWASYGEQAKGMKAFLVGAGAAQGKGASVSMLGKFFDGMIAGAEQSEQLVIELGISANVPQVSVVLVPKPGSSIAKFATAQRASDFSLLGKLSAASASFVAAGRLDLSGAGATFVDLMLEGAPAGSSRAEAEELMRLWTGETAMAATLGTPDATNTQYLLSSNNAARMLALMPRLVDVMSSGSLMGGQVKMKRTPLPPLEAEGLTITQSDVAYDFTAMPGYVGKKQFSVAMQWTGWDQTVAMAMGVLAKQGMLDLIASARHAQGSLVLTAAQRASLARARASKESCWMWLDPGALPAQPDKPMQIPPKLTVAMSFGVTGTSPHLRVSMLAR